MQKFNIGTKLNQLLYIFRFFVLELSENGYCLSGYLFLKFIIFTYIHTTGILNNLVNFKCFKFQDL